MQKSLQFSRVSYTQYEALYAVSTRSVSASSRGRGKARSTTMNRRRRKDDDEDENEAPGVRKTFQMCERLCS